MTDQPNRNSEVFATPAEEVEDVLDSEIAAKGRASSESQHSSTASSDTVNADPHSVRPDANGTSEQHGGEAGQTAGSVPPVATSDAKETAAARSSDSSSLQVSDTSESELGLDTSSTSVGQDATTDATDKRELSVDTGMKEDGETASETLAPASPTEAAGHASSGTDATGRPFSLAVPETPSAESAATSLAQSDVEKRKSEHPAWRDSTATSTLDDVSLSGPNSPVTNDDASEEHKRTSTSSSLRAFNDAVYPTASTSRIQLDDPADILSSKRAARPSPPARGESSHEYDFLMQRVSSQNALYEKDPKAKRSSMLAQSELRASFDQLRKQEQEQKNGSQPVQEEEEEEQHAASGTESAASPTQKHLRRASIVNKANGQGPAIDWDFWGEVMADYEGMAKTRPKELSQAIQAGIPPALRGYLWQLMSASKDPALEATYSDLMKRSSPHEKAIMRDLNRTFPTHEYFSNVKGVGQGNLLNVVKAYSLYDEEVGYCQGMAFVVGPLLLNMPDEEAFCVLVRLMKQYDLRSQYVPDMPGLQLRLFQLDRLLEELLPAVFMHLLRQGIKSSMYASQWFMTLLAYRFPLELVSSVFDLIFAEGVEAIFRFAIALMKRNEQRICELDFEDLLEFLKTGLFERYKMELQESSEDGAEPTYSSHNFVKEALQIKITPMMLDQYASEWTDMIRQQNAHSAEVEQLRAINKKLSRQVRDLEHSLSQINTEHCELVKQVVHSKLEKEELEEELVRVKMALAEETQLREEGRASRGSIASTWSWPSRGNSDSAK